MMLDKITAYDVNEYKDVCMAIKKIEGLEIEAEALGHRMWFCTIQRIALVVLICIVMATVLGLTGYGLLGYSTAGNKHNDVWVSYDRFLRKQASTHLVVHINNRDTASNLVTLQVAQTYLQRFYIKQILPVPAAVTTDNGNIIYHFLLQPHTALTVEFFLEPNSAGWVNGAVSLNQSMINFRQFIYP